MLCWSVLVSSLVYIPQVSIAMTRDLHYKFPFWVTAGTQVLPLLDGGLKGSSQASGGLKGSSQAGGGLKGSSQAGGGLMDSSLSVFQD